MTLSTETQRLQIKQCIEDIKNINELSRHFYRELFQLDLSFEKIFSGSVVTLNRKFSNMMNTLKNVKHLEKIKVSIEQMGVRHLYNYGVQIEHFTTAQKALLLALEHNAKKPLDKELKAAWQAVFSDVSAIMKTAMQQADRRDETRPKVKPMEQPLLDELGGVEQVEKVHQRFYDVMFDHPWLEQFFYGKDKQALVTKQTQFMVAAFGGENHYKGDTPAFIHMHMYITDEIADLRQQILQQAIKDEGLSDALSQRWLAVDDSFRQGIVKKSVDECVLKCFGQMPIVAKKPDNF